MIKKTSKIYVAGHTGLAGSAILRKLETEGYSGIITRTHNELDLTEQRAVRAFFQKERIDHVILAAARVGGIHANSTYPAEFIYTNLVIEANVIHEAWQAGVDRLLFLGSSCIYPKKSMQPIKEEYLLSGPLEPTNEPYAIAKIAGIKLCESYNRQYGTRYRSVMPTNLYGTGDNFDLEDSHVLPAMIRKFHLGKLATNGDWDAISRDQDRFGPIPGDIAAMLLSLSRSTGQPGPPLKLFNLNPDYILPEENAIVLWGSGAPYREFLYVDDMASASVLIMGLPDDVFVSGSESRHLSFLNVGCGKDISIKELAGIVAGAVGYTSRTGWDKTKQDGPPRKLLDISRLREFGWSPQTGLVEGIKKTYEWYLTQL